jgi:hypothetical protein
VNQVMPFSALHAIAAQRGDGLRPELKRLLEQHRDDTEPQPAAMRSIALEAADQDEVAELPRRPDE